MVRTGKEYRDSLGTIEISILVPFGMLLGTFSVSLMSFLPDGLFLTWGWRVPFLLSALLVAIGIWIAVDLKKHLPFKEEKQNGNVVKVPLSTFICILCVASFISVTFLRGTKKASPVDSSVLQGDIVLK